MSRGFKIGFFDSGVGGLNVLYEAFLCLPKNTSFVYYADHDNVPYGNKSSGEIKNLLFHALRFLKLEGCDAIVIACNTASSVANKEFRASFGVPIIAMEPAIKLAIVNYPESRILITATQATIIGEKLKNLLDNLNAKNCDLMALPRLVNYAQAGDFRSAGGYLSTIGLYKYDVVVLGCTHFNYFKKEMKLANLGLDFVDGNFGTIRHLAHTMDIDLGKNRPDIAELMKKTKFFISDLEITPSEILLFEKCLARVKMSRSIK